MRQNENVNKRCEQYIIKLFNDVILNSNTTNQSHIVNTKSV